MYKVFIAYIIVFFLECCLILTPITIGSIELKFSIIFELYMFVGLLLRFNKFYLILSIIKELKFLFLTLLISLIVIAFKSYFFDSLVLSLRIILILSVSFIPFVFNFKQKKITRSFKIFEICVFIYSLYTLFVFVANGHFGTRFFGPMGDTFAWVIGPFIVKYFIEKKYFRFGFFALYLIIVTGSISSLILSFVAVGLFAIKRMSFNKKIKIILFFCASFLLISFLLPNLIYNSSLYNRFISTGSSGVTNFENNSNYKLISLIINFDEITSSLFQFKGFGSTAFLAEDISRNYNLLINNEQTIVTATLPAFEIIKFIREFGVLGIYIYIFVYYRLIKKFLNNNFIGENSYLNYYFGLYMIFSFLIITHKKSKSLFYINSSI